MARYYIVILLIIFFPLIALAQTYPRLQEGEWRFTASQKNNPGQLPAGLIGDQEAVACLDAETQDRMIEKALREQGCTRPVIQRSGNSYSTSLTCGPAKQPVKVATRINLVSETSLSGTAAAETGPLAVEMLLSGRFLGACKQGRKPGDYVSSSKRPQIDISALPGLEEMLQNINR